MAIANEKDSLEVRLDLFDQLDKKLNIYQSTDLDSARITIAKLIELASQIGRSQQALAYYKKGMLQYQLQHFDSARTSFYQSISLADTLKVKDIKILAFNYEALGNICDRKANYHEAVQLYKKSKFLFVRAGFIGYTANLNNFLADDFLTIGKFDSALIYTLDNIQIRNKIHDNQITLNSYARVAKLYSDLHNYKEAYHYLLEGIEYAVTVNDSSSLANLYYRTGKLFIIHNLNEKVAIDYMIEAQKLYMKLNPNFDINSINLSIGDAYHSLGNDTLALTYYSDVVHSTSGTKGRTLSDAFYKMAILYESKGKTDSAMICFQQSIDSNCSGCPKIYIFQTLVDYAKTYMSSGNYSQSHRLLNQAKSIAENAVVAPAMVTVYEAVGYLYENQNMMDSSLLYYQKAYAISNRIQMPEKMMSIAKAISHLYYLKKDYKIAADFMIVADSLSLDLERMKKSDELAKLEMKLEIDRNEQNRLTEAQNSMSELRRQKLIRNVSIAGVVLFLIAVFILLRLYRNKKAQNRQLDQQKAEITNMAKQLHETDKNKLQFFTNISHEIRTPLTLIKFPIEKLLQSPDLDQEMKHTLNLALSNTNNLQQIVNQILDLRKIDDLKFELCLSDLELISFLKEMAASYDPLCQKTNCRLIMRSDVSEVHVRVDRERLFAILNNLLSNAFKYNKKEGEVVLSCHISPKNIKLSVSDTGIGIAKDHLHRLFDRYYQTHSSHQSNGSGIGLSYVKELIDLMGGSINVDSLENTGTTVTIDIPVETISVRNDKPFEVSFIPHLNLMDHLSNHIDANSGAEKTQKILIVEDNHDLRTFIGNMFSNDYQILFAEDGDQGRELAELNNPDIIISDIMMPGLQGNELCQIIKNNLQTSHIPFILLTARDDRESQITGYECGADDYLVKPFDSQILVHKVENILKTQDNARKQFKLADFNPANLACPDIDKDFLKRCINHINENLDQSGFTVEQLSSELAVSRKTLLRKLKALTGETPSDLIKHARMSRAASLLKEKKLRVNEVALMVGYENTERFSSAFKQTYGKSPSSFY